VAAILITQPGRQGTKLRHWLRAGKWTG